MENLKIKCCYKERDSIVVRENGSFKGSGCLLLSVFQNNRFSGNVNLTIDDAARLRDWLNDQIGDNSPLDGMSRDVCVRISHEGGVTVDGYNIAREVIEYDQENGNGSSEIYFRKK